MTPERLNRLMDVAVKRQKNITLILENVEDPHNIAAVLRTCDAIGIMEVFVLNTRIARHKKFGNKSSSSANKWVQVHQFDNLNECIYAVRKKFDYIICSYLKEQAKDLYSINFDQKIALVFGNETHGVSEELKKMCDDIFIIPQVGMIKSLNISVACAVTLYEALRQKRILKHYDNAHLNEPEIKNFLTLSKR